MIEIQEPTRPLFDLNSEYDRWEEKKEKEKLLDEYFIRGEEDVGD